MNFSGALNESSGMTVTRLIERIVHTDTPGELRLHDDASGRRATIAIRRSMVQEVQFGALSGDTALTAISQTTPWSFEFVADEAGAVPAHPGIVSTKPRARPVVRTTPVTAVVSPASFPPPHLDWLTAPAPEYALRFGANGADFRGEIHEDDRDYFRSDFEFLRATAASIARSLGAEIPRVFAIAEADRATGYTATDAGFLGIMGGAGTGVAHVIDFPAL